MMMAASATTLWYPAETYCPPHHGSPTAICSRSAITYAQRIVPHKLSFRSDDDGGERDHALVSGGNVLPSPPRKPDGHLFEERDHIRAEDRPPQAVFPI